jgi:hypothetical protein
VEPFETTYTSSCSRAEATGLRDRARAVPARDDDGCAPPCGQVGPERRGRAPPLDRANAANGEKDEEGEQADAEEGRSFHVAGTGDRAGR